MIPAAQVVEIRRLFFAEHWRLGTIATQLGLHADTVRRALATDRFARPAVVRPSLCDPYRAFLQATLQQVPPGSAPRGCSRWRRRGGTPARSCSSAGWSGRFARSRPPRRTSA